MPNATAYLVGEVRFGPGVEGFGDITALTPGQRPVPMPWEIVPVFAWYREGDGVKVVAGARLPLRSIERGLQRHCARWCDDLARVGGGRTGMPGETGSGEGHRYGQGVASFQALQSAAWGEGATGNQALGEAWQNF